MVDRNSNTRLAKNLRHSPRANVEAIVMRDPPQSVHHLNVPGRAVGGTRGRDGAGPSVEAFGGGANPCGSTGSRTGVAESPGSVGTVR